MMAARLKLTDRARLDDDDGRRDAEKSCTFKPANAVTKSGRSSGRCARARGGARTRALGRVETRGASQLERGEARRRD